MKLTKLTIALLFALLTIGSWAQGPNNSGTYYQSADGKKGAALKTELSKIIHPHTNLGYDGLYEAYKKTDTRSDGTVRDWYSKTTKYRHVTDKAGSYKKEGDCYNREHSVPQSWFGSGEIKSDIVHVLPTDGYVNNQRSNIPFGEVSSASYTSNGGYCKKGSCKTPGYSGTVFEPGDDIKGDLARIYFYMATCYESKAYTWGHDVFTGTAYQPFSKWAFDMLIRWARQDTIDAVEIARNNAVFETQKNRNPFVDYPGLEDYVWGSKKDVPFSYDKYEGSNYPIPDPIPDPDPQPEPQPVDGEIALNNILFGVSWSGAKPSNSETVLTGTANGITITYSIGSSANMFCDNEQIRMYGGNELKIESGSNEMERLEFVTIDSSKKLLLLAGGGHVDGYTWTGKTKSVTFGSEGNHIKIGAVKVTMAQGSPDDTGITSETMKKACEPIYYDLQGCRVYRPVKGMYILNGRKVVINKSK